MYLKLMEIHVTVIVYFPILTFVQVQLMSIV